MKRVAMWVPIASVVAYASGAPLYAAEPNRCEGMFKEQAAIATCNTISNMYGSDLSDEHLRERVSKAIYGMSADRVERELQRQESDRQKKEAEAEAVLLITDQCYRLFTDPLERETCRTLRMLTTGQRTDDEMRNDVRERIKSYGMDVEKQMKTAIEAEEKRKAYDIWLHKTAIDEEERRKAEAVRQKRAAVEREKKRMDAKRALDARLKKGTIGFSFTSWERSGFGTVLIIHFILQNNTSMPKKDFEVECDTKGNSGTLLGSARKTLYEQLEAGGRRVFSLNMGLVHSQTARTSCAVIKWASS